METRSPYPTDVSDEEWAFVAPYQTLLPEDAGQRKYPLREVFNGVRSIVKSGAHWRMLPHDLPPWPLGYQQLRRWMYAGCFETIVHDLRILLRRAAERPVETAGARWIGRCFREPLQPTRASGSGARRATLLGDRPAQGGTRLAAKKGRPLPGRGGSGGALSQCDLMRTGCCLRWAAQVRTRRACGARSRRSAP
jgi:transposase